MGSARSPKALPLQGLLPWLFLLACPECRADVQVSVPAVMDVLLGDPVSILCTHTVTGGDSYLLVEWFITDKNGEQRRVAYSDQGQQGVDRGTEYTDRVSMDPSHSLVIQAAAVSDERAFSCQVTSTSGNGMGVTQLKVYDPPEPPEVVQNSGSVSVIQDHASEIATCNSNNANPVPTISWYKDGRLLNASTERNKKLYVVSRTVKEASGLQSVSSTLYLRVNKADKDSMFLCKVSYAMPYGKVGSAESEPFQLKVHYYTENVRFALDSPKVIKEGDDVQLQCKADGFPEPEYFFTKLQKLTPGVEQDMGSSPTGILSLPSVTKDSSGTYRCQVLDFDSPDEVELEQEVTIFVNYLDPLVMNPSEMVTANLSANLKLTCLGTGSQAPTLSWWKGKEQVGSGETLVLDSLTYHKAGTYTCQASVPSIPGLQQNESVQVTVEGKPEMEQHQAIGHYHSLGQTVLLTCTALGHPQPAIRWSMSGKEDLRHSGNKVIGELSVEVTPELVQSGVKCWAENSYGSAEQTFRLEIVSPTASSSPGPAVDSEESQGGSTVAVIAVCVCVLLLLLIVGFFYFMQRRGQLPCGGGEKRSLTPREGNPDDTVVEMKTDKRNEQTGLLSPGGGGGGGGGTNEC